nr:unnamed protein product [Callosobruchus analis]
MSQGKPMILELLASSVKTADKAGQIIKDVMTKGDLGIVEKGAEPNDLQTEADRSAQRCIIASLAKKFPGVTIIGEEGPSHRIDDVPQEWLVSEVDEAVLSLECPPQFKEIDAQDVVVWVDPLDGTSEYTQGLLDHVTVLIGIAVKGRAIAGVIHQPYYGYKSTPTSLGRTIWGLVGAGIGGMQAQTPPKGELVLTTTRSHNTELVVRALEALSPSKIVRVGGAGHKALLVIEGLCHAYVFASKGCKKWDTCAPEAVLEAAGGVFTDLHGNHYSYGKNVSYPDSQGIFATAKGVDHAALLAKIPQALKDAFPPS